MTFWPGFPRGSIISYHSWTSILNSSPTTGTLTLFWTPTSVFCPCHHKAIRLPVRDGSRPQVLQPTWALWFDTSFTAGLDQLFSPSSPSLSPVPAAQLHGTLIWPSRSRRLSNTKETVSKLMANRCLVLENPHCQSIDPSLCLAHWLVFRSFGLSHPMRFAHLQGLVVISLSRNSSSTFT